MRNRTLGCKSWHRQRCEQGRNFTTSGYHRTIEIDRRPAHPNTRRSTRFAPTELTTFQVKGILRVIRKEPDQDYHLVITDPINPRVTMIVESPDPTCALGSQFLDNITSVRTMLDRTLQLNRVFSPENRRSELSLPVTVTGVGFFDVLHGQEGVARNGIELHPVLMIDFQH